MSDVTIQDVYFARRNIADIARKTPMIPSPWLSEYISSNVYLKLESLQETGSFKIRGATNKILNLPEEERSRGLITVSSGNHGRALSHVAHRLGIKAVVCLPETVPDGKREAIQNLGPETIVHGKTFDETMAYAFHLQEEQGFVMVHAFDDPYVIAGQGTIGLEMLDDFPDVDTVIVPLSAGGLLGGIAFTLKSIRPGIRTIGVSMERGPAMVESLKAGRVVDIVEEPTLADALIGGIGRDNKYTFKMVQKYVDDTALVSEDEIAAAMTFALEKHHLVVEGGGAVGIAALLCGRVSGLGENVAVVVSGSNVDLSVLIQVAGGRYDYQSKK